MNNLLHKKIDQAGICVSSVCAIHCLLMPFVLAFGSVGFLSVLHHPVVEAGIISASLGIGLFSFIPGFSVHRKLSVLSTFGAGLLFILVGEVLVPHWGSEWPGTLASVSGALMLIFSHYQNRKFIRNKMPEDGNGDHKA